MQGTVSVGRKTGKADHTHEGKYCLRVFCHCSPPLHFILSLPNPLHITKIFNSSFNKHDSKQTALMTVMASTVKMHSPSS
jgi:hypothetical protein